MGDTPTPPPDAPPSSATPILDAPTAQTALTVVTFASFGLQIAEMLASLGHHDKAAHILEASRKSALAVVQAVTAQK